MTRPLPSRRAVSGPVESPRITLARVLALGVRVTWREAMAIVHEAVAATGAADHPGPALVTAESCVLTRGGDVVLTGAAAQARREVVVRLLDDLLASCSDPGRFAGAVANGTALGMIEELSQDTTAKRRRVEVAAVALRGLVAAADADRAMADADKQELSPDVDRVSAKPPRSAGTTLALVTSTTPGSRPSPTLRPTPSPRDLPSARPQVSVVRPSKDLRGGSPPLIDWVNRASPALV